MSNREAGAAGDRAACTRQARTVANSIEATILFVLLALIAARLGVSNPLTQ